ncbi:MAG TPA: oxidoreductase, partial [Spirochaetales bacterium]|nr:oxidoreductase [Spirochaetales bacterium]
DVYKRQAKGPWLDRVPEHMTVIGGGNVAFDIARTMARLQKQKFGKVKIDLLCLESREEMQADEEEIIEGMEEGIKVHPSYGPKDIVVEKGRVTGVEFIKCLSVFDEEGRFSPKFDEGQKLTIETGYVVESIGQGANISYIPEKIRKQLEFTPAGKFKVNEEGQTSLPWLFAGGDIVRGPDVITGIADGHRAARGIDRYLSG